MTTPSTIRNVAFVGIHHSGKTSLIESLLFLTEAISRRGKILDGTSTCDWSPEAINRQMSTSVSSAHTTYRDHQFNIIDCPGFIDFSEEVKLALLGVDTAVFVLEPDPGRIVQIEPMLQYAEEIGLASIVFINKVDKPDVTFDETLNALQGINRRGKRLPLVPLHYPVITNSSLVGYVELLTRTGYKYGTGGSYEKMDVPEEVSSAVQHGHEKAVESLADVDDAILEMVMEGKDPPLDLLESDLKKAVRHGSLIPVLAGAGLTDAGVTRLLDAIIDYCPAPSEREYKDVEGKAITVSDDGPVVGQIIKTYIHPQFGKLSLTRVFTGTVRGDSRLTDTSIEGAGDERIGGLYELQGKKQDPVQSAGPGAIVAIARLEKPRTGDTLTSNNSAVVMKRPPVPPPLYQFTIAPKSRADEAKVMTLVGKLLEEDPTLSVEYDPDVREHRLGGQGEMGLKVALEKLDRQYHLQVATDRPKIAYKEAIQGNVEAHGRHKKQTGGHGQFGEVYLRIEPLERGAGSKFTQSTVGGSVPSQYHPGVEKGVNEALNRGPLAGFPLVDISVNLFDGSYHDVDSDEMSFRMAAILAMREGLPKCRPQILEPIASVTAIAPTAYISGVLSQVTGRRGQILGYAAREGQPGWDEVNAYIPQSELWDWIIDLRTLTQGLGTYTWQFSHLAPVPAQLGEELKKAAASQEASS